MSGNDTVSLDIKYFCLKDTKLIIPKRYEFTDNPPKDFVTHPFAINVTMSANGDTVLNKKFTVATLSPFFEDPFDGALIKYGSIIDIPALSKQHLEAHTIVLNFSVSIPTTDLGVPFTLIIKTDGTYTGHSY